MIINHFRVLPLRTMPGVRAYVQIVHSLDEIAGALSREDFANARRVFAHLTEQDLAVLFGGPRLAAFFAGDEYLVQPVDFLAVGSESAVHALGTALHAATSTDYTIGGSKQGRYGVKQLYSNRWELQRMRNGRPWPKINPVRIELYDTAYLNAHLGRYTP